MSAYTSFASGGSVSNPNLTYETIGLVGSGADAGKGTTITSAAAPNKGSYVQLSAAISADWAGFFVCVTAANSSGNRYLIDIATGPALAEADPPLVPNLFAFPGTAGAGVQSIFFPLNVASGTRLAARCQSNGGATGTCQVSIVGVQRASGMYPLYNNVELLVAADTTNARPSATSVTGVSTAGTGWTQVVASTAREYGALVPNLGVTGTVPTTAQSLAYRLATGAAASEALIFETQLCTTAANPYTGRMTSGPIYKTIASGTRVAAEVVAATASETYSPQIYGCY